MGFSYFSYFFNNIVRNTVAHGNYNFLVTSGRTGEEGSKDHVDESVIRRIIALELLLDLQYLVHMIAKINEIDTAKKYITEVYDYYVSSDEGEDGDPEDDVKLMLAKVNSKNSENKVV